MTAYFNVLKFSLVVILSAYHSCHGWVVDDSGCITPDNQVGNCILIHNCQPINDFISKYPKPIPPATNTALNNYLCGYVNKTKKVCCPTQLPQNNMQLRMPEESAFRGPPDPPIVTNHKNFHLLPRDCGYIDLGDKIKNGQDAAFNEFPWMALLSYKTDNGPLFQCGATIVNEQWILTAAHCLVNLKYPLLSVRVGEQIINETKDCVILRRGRVKCADPVQDLAIVETYPHPQYNRYRYTDDIGLIKVTKMDTSVENVRPVCLPTGADRRSKLKNRKVVVTGWGLTETNKTSTILQKVKLKTVTLDSCRKSYKREPAKISYKHICAGGTDDKGSCKGDSGGPLQLATVIDDETRYVQHGVVNFGHINCGTEGYPAVFANVDYYMDWILDTIH